MAPTQWSNLPEDILLIIVILLNSDVDLLRLRSVCSSWRSSLPTRTKPYSFPMKLPPFFSDSSYSSPLGDEHFSLNYSSLYRLSPLNYAGESSKGWLLRVLEVRPNTFSLLTPLLPEKIQCSSEMIPKELNLLNYRISEICKCYQLDFVNVNGSINKIGSVTELGVIIRKVIVLWDFFDDCEFAVLALVSKKTKDWTWMNNDLRYWKYGDKDWTPIDIQNYEFDDVIFFGGKCYAIGFEGDLVSFDSDFNLSLHYTSDEYIQVCHNNFVVYKSDLFIVSKIYNREPDEMSSEFDGPYSSCDDFDLASKRRLFYDSEDEEEEEKENGPFCCSTDEYDDDSEEAIVEDDCSDEIPLRAKIFKVRDGDGWQYTNLGWDDIFLSSDDVSVGLQKKDFSGCSGNCVYMAHRYFSHCDEGIEYGDGHGVFRFYGTRSLILNRAPDFAKIYWPPPDWLHH